MAAVADPPMAPPMAAPVQGVASGQQEWPTSGPAVPYGGAPPSPRSVAAYPYPPHGGAPPSPRSVAAYPGGPPFDPGQAQVAPPAGTAPWYPPNPYMQPGNQGAYPWPNHMMPPPYYGTPPPWHGGVPNGEWAPYMQGDQAASPRMQPPSPRMVACSPRLPDPRLTGAAMPEQVDPAAEGNRDRLLPCRPCRWSCKQRCAAASSGAQKRLQTAGSRLRLSLRKCCRPCIDSPAVQSGQWRRKWLVIFVGLASIGCLLAALLQDPPNLIAAGLASVLGWLCIYAYFMQRECWRLASELESDFCRQLKVECAKDTAPSTAETSAHAGSMDLDVTTLARSLGSPFCNASSCLPVGGGKSGQTMQAVLTSALVNEYLRCARLLQKYQHRHGILPNAPECNPGFAEALLSGLGGPGSVADASKQSAGLRMDHASSPMAASAANGGTPNFAERASSSSKDTSPTPMRISPTAEAQKAAAAANEASNMEAGLSDMLEQNSGSAASSVPPPPAGELPRCDTITTQTGPSSSFAARMEDLESSVNDPAWLRQVNRARAAPAPAPAQDIDSSVNDPPWLRQIRAR